MTVFFDFVRQKLNANEPTPLYQKLDRAIRDSIREGILKPDDYLPSERVLREELSVSRKTVRNAFEKLREDKVISSAQGLGTYVTRKINYDIKSGHGFSEIVSNHGGTPSTQWLLKDKVSATAEVAEKLAIEKGSEVYQLKRLRFIDGVASSIENSFVRQEFIDHPEAIGDSLYQYFQAQKIVITGKKSYISAALPEPDICKQMKIAEGCPVLVVKQLVHDQASGLPIEYSVSFCRSDVYEFIFED